MEDPPEPPAPLPARPAGRPVISGSRFRGPQQVRLPSYTVTIEDPDEAKARRQRQREENRYRRRRADLLLAYGLVLVGVAFLAGLGLVVFSAGANQELGRSLILLIVGGFVGFLTGRASGGKENG